MRPREQRQRERFRDAPRAINVDRARSPAGARRRPSSALQRGGCGRGASSPAQPARTPASCKRSESGTRHARETDGGARTSSTSTSRNSGSVQPRAPLEQDGPKQTRGARDSQRDARRRASIARIGPPTPEPHPRRATYSSSERPDTSRKAPGQPRTRALDGDQRGPTGRSGSRGAARARIRPHFAAVRRPHAHDPEVMIRAARRPRRRSLRDAGHLNETPWPNTISPTVTAA